MLRVTRKREYPPGPYAEFGTYLRNLRDRSGKSWGQVCRLVSTSTSTISRDENGDSPDIPFERLEAYARVYNTAFEVLLRKWLVVRCGVDFSSMIEITKVGHHGEEFDRLAEILERAPDTDKLLIERLIHLISEELQQSAKSRRGKKAVEGRAGFQGVSDKILPFTAISHDHDAPQEVSTVDLRYFESVPAGDPSHVEPTGFMTVPVLAHLARANGDKLYLLKVTGDSMADEIRDGDLVLVDCNRQPKNRDIVVALLNGESTVKQFLRRKGKVTLHPLNPKHKDIEIGPEDEVVIQGVVTDLVRRALR